MRETKNSLKNWRIAIFTCHFLFKRRFWPTEAFAYKAHTMYKLSYNLLKLLISNNLSNLIYRIRGRGSCRSDVSVRASRGTFLTRTACRSSSRGATRCCAPGEGNTNIDCHQKTYTVLYLKTKGVE